VGGFAIRLILSHKQFSLFYIKKLKKEKKVQDKIIFMLLMYEVLLAKSTSKPV